MRIPLGLSSFVREVAESPQIPLVNRYFEETPTNQEDGVSILRRPAFKKWKTLGTDPIFAVYHQPGSFSESLFVATGKKLFKIAPDGTETEVSGGVLSGKSKVKMAATSSFGSVPEYLFVSDEKNLWLYSENKHASTTGEFTSNPVEGDTIRVADVYYKFTTGNVDVGTPDGSAGSPYLIAVRGSAAASRNSFIFAVEAVGDPGEDYSETLKVPNSKVRATLSAAEGDTFALYARESGSAGNSVTAAVISGSSVTLTSGTFTGGGTTSFDQVVVPDYYDVIDIAYISSYVVVAVGGPNAPNGRFYWIEPGDTIIDAFNFATAERSPDPLLAVQSYGDQLCFFGTDTTEIWYPRGDADAPFRRLQGRLFDRGITKNTDLVIKDSLYIIDAFGVVYSLADEPQRLSDSGIEERIREFLASSDRDSIKTWSLELDGHIFYVVGLGSSGTLCLDISTGAWSEWKSKDKDFLVQGEGVGWLGAGSSFFSGDHDNNIVVGDRTTGALWKVAPKQGYDEPSASVSELIKTEVVGGVPVKMRQGGACKAVYLACSKGKPQPNSGNEIELFISDDAGKNWLSVGEVPVADQDYTQEVAWRSLGRIKAPGRLFKVVESGAVARIDGLDMKG